jgi:hypothetical protein
MAKPNKAEVEQAALDEMRARISKHSQEQKVAPPLPPISDRLKEYSEYFVRDENLFVQKTKSSDRTKQLIELVRHVFQKYPVPSFMNYIWTEPDQPSQTAGNPNYYRQVRENAIKKYAEYEMWYITIATGGSLYKEWFKAYNFTKRETHLFLTCRFDLTIPQAQVFAVGKAVGAKDGNALRVARSKLVEKNLKNEFWKHAIRFFAVETDLTVDLINDLTDYLNFKQNERAQPGQVNFVPFELAGSGHTLASLTKKMHDWHYDMRRIKVIGEASWEGIPVADQDYIRRGDDGKKSIWHFKQIKTAKELQQEGNAQRHCVFGYKGSCVAGSVSIWSLSHQDEYGGWHRKITIELTKGGNIVQARGLANRLARPDEVALMTKWASDHGFSYRGGYY